MTSVEVLVATMRHPDLPRLVDEMGIQGPAVVVNQWSDGSGTTHRSEHADKIFIDSGERGLSRSRNLALEHAQGDVCVLADDDEVFGATYTERVAAAFDTRPNSDVIAFAVQDRAGVRKKPLSATALTRLQLMQVSSVQIAFRRSRVLSTGVTFDVAFGAGSDHPVGEELVFLNDLRRAGLRISAVPLEIAHLEPGPSSWFTGFDERFFRARGASFARADSALGEAYAAQWALRKWRLYRDSVDVGTAIRWMRAGAAAWRASA